MCQPDNNPTIKQNIARYPAPGGELWHALNYYDATVIPEKTTLSVIYTNIHITLTYLPYFVTACRQKDAV